MQHQVIMQLLTDSKKIGGLRMNQIVVTQLEKTLEQYGVSQNRAAKDIGYSSSVISDYRSGKYKGDVEKLEEAIIKWVARVKQANAKKKVAIVETSALTRICNAISIAHSEKDIALIVDDAGAGKSTAAKWYADHNPRTAILLHIVAGMNRKALVQELAKELGLDVYRVQQQTLIQNVANALAERDIVVILDEADNLKADALEFTRRIVYDLGNSGLVLIGLPRLTGYIQNLKSDHRQLESRIGVYLPLCGLTKKDASLIAQSVWPQVDKEIVDALYGISKTDVRQFTKIIERAQNIMAVNKLESCDFEVVEMAAQMVIRRNWR